MATKKTRRANYRSASTPATVQKQDRIKHLLALAGEGFTLREIGRLLGISRQLALYHVKKMAAAGQIVMVLEPCTDNGGIQFRVWDELALAAFYSRVMLQTMQPEGARRAA